MGGSKDDGTFTQRNTAAKRKEELLPFVTAWMEVESFMLSKISQEVGDNTI